MNSIFLDTLAAAYAETGNFEEAVITQETAIAFLKCREGESDIPAAYMKRLKSYKAKKSWRE